MNEFLCKFNLAGCLSSGKNDEKWVPLVMTHAIKRSYLARKEKSCTRRKEPGNACDRRMRPMRSAECVIDIILAEAGKLFSKLKIILLLLLPKSDIFQHAHSPLFKSSKEPSRPDTERVPDKHDPPFEKC